MVIGSTQYAQIPAKRPDVWEAQDPMSSIELYALWQSHAHDAIRAFSGTAAAAQRQLGVAVVLPDMPSYTKSLSH